MKSNQLSRRLRLSALAVVIAGVAVWAGTGARLGWTQTKSLTVQRDDVTGIEYPVWQPAFKAGVEIPLLALVIAGALAGLGHIASRHAGAKA
jgi:hypothetical protein